MWVLSAGGDIVTMSLGEDIVGTVCRGGYCDHVCRGGYCDRWCLGWPAWRGRWCRWWSPATSTGPSWLSPCWASSELRVRGAGAGDWWIWCSKPTKLSAEFSQSQRRPLLRCLNSVLNVRAQVGIFNEEKALVEASYVIGKTLPMVRLQLYRRAC